MLRENRNFKVVNDAFPHIGKRIQLFWGEPEFKAYMEDLQTMTRGGHREGFPKEVAQALFALALKHGMEHPKMMRSKEDLWDPWA
jgi:hypothetical protein